MLNTGKVKNSFVKVVFLAAVYALPYPGLMPGHRLYPAKQVFDRVYRHFVFGSFASHKYELGLADKKLVEAKVLFEYQQYLLAIKALEESDLHFKKAIDYLLSAEIEDKNSQVKTANLQAASDKHREILTTLVGQTPAEYLWQPEKSKAQPLAIHQYLQKAIIIRQIR